VLSSDLFHVSSEHNVDGQEVGRAGFDEATADFAFPHALHPLANALKSADILEQRVNLRRLECERHHLVFVAEDLILWLVAIKVLVIFLYTQRTQIREFANNLPLR
jgi:hypothetical protein